MGAEPGNSQPRTFEPEYERAGRVKQAAGYEPRHLRRRQGARYRHDEKRGYPSHRDVKRAGEPERGAHPENLHYEPRRGGAPDERKHHVAERIAEGDDAYRRVGTGDKEEYRYMVEPLHETRGPRSHSTAAVIYRARGVEQHHAYPEYQHRRESRRTAAAKGAAGELYRSGQRGESSREMGQRARDLPFVFFHSFQPLKAD